jgi:hypothetical protein
MKSIFKIEKILLEVKLMFLNFMSKVSLLLQILILDLISDRKETSKTNFCMYKALMSKFLAINRLEMVWCRFNRIFSNIKILMPSKELLCLSKWTLASQAASHLCKKLITLTSKVIAHFSFKMLTNQIQICILMQKNLRQGCRILWSLLREIP